MKQKNISNSKFLYKNIRWILFVIALLIFFLLAITILNQGEFAFDEQAFKVLKNWESPGLTAFFKTVTALASAPVLILFCLCCISHYSLNYILYSSHLLSIDHS